MKKEQIKAGDKVSNLDNNHKTVEVIQRDRNLVFIKVNNNNGNIHYNGALVWLDGENERLNPWMITDPDMYRRSKEECYAVYLQQVAKKEQEVISKASAKAEADKQDGLDAICHRNAIEARELQASLRVELVSAQLQATGIKALLKDKKSQIEQLTAINTLINSNIFNKN